ncbi:hypothetical protein DFH07DRAFT_803988 [Mycena maculata]|uniref:G-protein coupled receptors family 2 profile 2 domain-containing protein n=1 Tax=Mycena maculata TaxID=230809 RepID=A0AAD7NR92_9AGAR|nr:hypothetical protein DFH07DRAFT_803988 [Mycena maculata]
MSNHKLHVPNSLDAHMEDVVLTFGIAGVVLPASLLLAIAYAAWNPISRLHLNRVSFRLLVCSLIANLIFAATSIPTFSGPSAGCSFMAFFGLSVLMFTACMFFCTALNLQLVLVHHLNGNSMEKFYYIGSVTLVAILNITPYAAGQFGYYNSTCWFSDPRPDVQFHWLFWSQSIWILLMSTGEVVSFFIILGYMYRMHRRKVLSNHSTLSSRPPIVMYRTTILRIGLYPLLSCCLNFSGSILDIWLTKNPVPTELEWRLSFVDLCVFGLRPILYTLLATSDPGFLCAMHALRTRSKSTHSIGPTSGIDSTGPTSSVTYTSSHRMKRFSMNTSTLVHVELEQGKHSSTAMAAGEDKSRVVSYSDSDAARGTPSFVEQDPESMLSETERGAAKELNAEAKTSSGAEDIARQI